MIKSLIKFLFPSSGGKVTPSYISPPPAPKYPHFSCIAQAILDDLHKDGWYISDQGQYDNPILENRSVKFKVWLLSGKFMIYEKSGNMSWITLDLYPNEFHTLSEQYKKIVTSNKGRALHEHNLKEENVLKRLFPHCYK